MNILIIGKSIKFEKHLSDCLKEHDDNCKTFFIKTITPSIDDFIEKNQINIIVVNLLCGMIKIKKELNIIFNLHVSKIVLLEKGNDLYYKNISIPFSVYKKFKSKNRKSKIISNVEDRIKESQKNFVIFRVSEVYGPSINFGIVYDLMNKQRVVLNKGNRDLIYEGDLIHAIETALRFDVSGIFDIAFGQSIPVEELVEIINKFRNDLLKVKWNKTKENYGYNCENFKFYKWQPLVSINSGIRTFQKILKCVDKI